MKTNFEIFRDSDNVIKTAENGYKTQCGQYKKEHTEAELKAYFIKEYCENNKERADEIADLFEHYEDLPEEVQKLIDENTEFQSYEDCEEFKNQLHKIGYTCEYGLDNIPHSLRKLETTNETPKEMKTTENIVFEHENNQVIQKGNHFFIRVTENSESFESGDFNTLERAKESLGIELTTTEKNILIALFMGGEDRAKVLNGGNKIEFPPRIENDIKIFKSFSYNELKYHSDWNWLMEVVEKIESLNEKIKVEIKSQCNQFSNKRFNQTSFINSENYDLVGHSGLNESKIESTYNAVIDFIQWNNQQKN